MKTLYKLLSVLLVAAGLAGCGIFSLNPDARSITPSDNIITENREVSGFTGVDMRTFGTITITQGDEEALVVGGSDNLVELIQTSVRDGVLVIEMENISVETLETDKMLTFDITVKDLDHLTVSGFATVEMQGLETESLSLLMSGAGAIDLTNLELDTISVNLSGVGGVILAGSANHAEIEISGGGEINAGDLKCTTANTNVSGLGTATLWVTENLTGKISGAGSVHYYGDPQTNTSSSRAGSFEALGNK